ncbi:dihydroorotate dehydrogenase [Brevibacillus sp. NRS-1366]|uniref:dihydroorotate dehydrogenase n=1 Tax=Brevibacillus sp. NRS-1366 TaxID=3233899 RepID=UPI003D203D16
MPDWSYRTLFRPLLFLLPAEKARKLTLTAIGTLAKVPGGPFIIELMGHMKPPIALSQPFASLTFPSPVGLGAGLDIDNQATEALSRFGFGYMELGPVTLQPLPACGQVVRAQDLQAISYSDPLANPGIEALVERLQSMRLGNVSLGARLACQPDADMREATEERIELIKRLDRFCSFFTLDTRPLLGSPPWGLAEWQQHLDYLRAATDRPLLLAIPPGLSEQEALDLVMPAREAGLNGLIIAGGIRLQQTGISDDELYITGKPSFTGAKQLVTWSRQMWPDCVIIGSGGIQEPADALAFLESGADFIQLHSGLVYSGPGLPKRINEAVWQSRCADSSPDSDGDGSDSATPPAPAPWIFPSWMWGVYLGLGMLIGGGLAWLLAATSVMLPYDERFLGAKAEELALLNTQLLPFMSHDRISLAGTMLSIGVIYFQLARHGLRRGLHWTRSVLLISGTVGFASFFLFIGYGYFDYLHAILSFLLFPFFLLAVREPANRQLSPLPLDLYNQREWKNALWGQLSFVIIGCGLTGAGLIISIIGVTGVFVPSDLVFLCVSAETLQAYNDRLIPLIAHDRAGFGGALVSCGLAVLLLTLWGFRRGEGWVWWTLFLAGIPGFVSGIGIHYAVGYVNFLHLLPAFVAALLFLIGLVLARPFLLETK